MAEQNDFSQYTDDELKKFIETGEAPQRQFRGPAGVDPKTGKPYTTQDLLNAVLPESKESPKALGNSEAEMGLVGVGGTINAMGTGLARAANAGLGAVAPYISDDLKAWTDRNAEDLKAYGKENAATMHDVRSTTGGAIGSAIPHAVIGAPARGASLLADMAASGVAGAATTGLESYGEGKSGDKALTDAVGGGAVNAAATGTLRGLIKGGNAALGRWDNPELKHLRDFARERGLELRTGDLDPSAKVVRAMENVSNRSHLSGTAEEQAKALENMLFGNGNKLLEGVDRMNGAIRDVNQKLWSPVYELAANSPITQVRPLGVRAALDDISAKYPSMLNKVDNVQLRDTLESIASAKNSHLPGITFEEARELQQSIGPEIRKMKLQALNGTITRDEADSMSRLYGALAGDLKRWGNHGNNQKVYDAYSQANDVFKREILPILENDIVEKHAKGVYANHNEALLKDLTSPANRTQVRQLLQYAKLTDKELPDYLETVMMADRAAKDLARGAAEPTAPSGLATFFAPKMAAAQQASGAASHHLAGPALYNASRNLRPGAVGWGALPDTVAGGGALGYLRSRAYRER